MPPCPTTSRISYWPILSPMRTGVRESIRRASGQLRGIAAKLAHEGYAPGVSSPSPRPSRDEILGASRGTSVAQVLGVRLAPALLIAIAPAACFSPELTDGTIACGEAG